MHDDHMHTYTRTLGNTASEGTHRRLGVGQANTSHKKHHGPGSSRQEHSGTHRSPVRGASRRLLLARRSGAGGALLLLLLLLLRGRALSPAASQVADEPLDEDNVIPDDEEDDADVGKDRVRARVDPQPRQVVDLPRPVGGEARRVDDERACGQRGAR